MNDLLRRVLHDNGDFHINHNGNHGVHEATGKICVRAILVGFVILMFCFLWHCSVRAMGEIESNGQIDFDSPDDDATVASNDDCDDCHRNGDDTGKDNDKDDTEKTRPIYEEFLADGSLRSARSVALEEYAEACPPISEEAGSDGKDANDGSNATTSGASGSGTNPDDLEAGRQC